MEIKKLMSRIQTLTEMMNEEMKSISEKTKYRNDYTIEHLNDDDYYRFVPDEPTYANLKRIMLMLRIETIKLDKIL